jgi:hypothetical protein
MYICHQNAIVQIPVKRTFHKREIDAVCCVSHAEMKLRILDQVGTEALAHLVAIEPYIARHAHISKFDNSW